MGSKTGSYAGSYVEVKPVDCVMSDWAKDGACSKTCGDGEQKMTRTVKTEAVGTGQECDAKVMKTDTCNTGACPVDPVVDPVVDPGSYSSSDSGSYSVVVDEPVDPCGDAKKSWLSGCTMDGNVKNDFACGSHCETKMAAWKTACADNAEETEQLGYATAAGGGDYCGPAVKPKFDEAAFKELQLTFTVSEKVFTAVAYVAPKDPVAPEETADFKYVIVEVEKEAVNVPFTFKMTEDEATDPDMQAALTGGIAKSLGLDSDAVTITHIGGKAVDTFRRLATGDLEITFQIVSDQADTTALEANIKEAAEEGSIVAAIQEEASAKGVLTQALKDMEIKLPAPTIEKTTVTVKVVQMVDKNAVTNAPTMPPTESIISGASATSASRVCLALVLCQAIMFVLL